MDEKLIESLLKQPEGPLLDFKTTFYDIADKKSKTDFVKDLLAFANSTLEKPGYILCGVKDNPNGRKDVIGIDPNTFIDDSRWVQILSSYSSHPVNFRIQKVTRVSDGKTIVLIEVVQAQQRPILCTREENGKLQQGVIYFRNGSINDVTRDLVTLEKIISKYSMKTPNDFLNNDPTYNRYSKFPPAPYYNFFGRDQEIDKIFQELVYHHKNYLLSLIGDGGSGKTSVAYKIAEQIKEELTRDTRVFDDVIWISAKDQRIYFDERRQLNKEFSSLEDLFNKILLVFYDSNYINSLDYAKKMIIVDQALRDTKFFFVLDNLEVFTDNQLREIYDFIKNAPLGHKFLLTSRHDLRVQDFIPIKNFDEELALLYTKDVFAAFNIPDDDCKEVLSHFREFYNLTNGNPLYIKYFLAQIKHDRKLDDILKRRNLDGEKGLKAYCFDSTLNMLNDDELKIMYSISVVDSNYLAFSELRYMTFIEASKLHETLERLTSVSLISREVRGNQQVYLINPLLKSYLVDEKRIPGAEFVRLYQKSRELSNVKPLNHQYAYNFGLRSLTNANEILSYTLILDILMNSSTAFNTDLDQIKFLYPGNYLIPFYKNFAKIRDSNLSEYSIYTDINAEFVNIDGQMFYPEERNMMYIWKSFLYMMLGRYVDVTKELETIISTEHSALIAVIKAAAINMMAFEEYNHKRFNKHDELRLQADDLFANYINDFLSKNYFYFIKQNLNYAYTQHLKHMKKVRNDSEHVNTKAYMDLTPFVPDLPLFRNLSLWTIYKSS